MKKFRVWLSLLIILLLVLPTIIIRAENYILPREMKASEVADTLGMSLEVFKKANPGLMTSGTLDSGTVVALPDISKSKLSNQPFLFEAGYVQFGNKDVSGFLFNGGLEAVLDLNRKKTLALGVCGGVQVGGLWLKDGTYNEPANSWSAGLVLKDKIPGMPLVLTVSYGQGKFYTQLATSAMQTLVNHFWDIKISAQFFTRRILGQTSLADVSIFAEVKIPTRNDTLFWTGRPVNWEMLPQKIELGGKVAIIDWLPNKQLIVPIYFNNSFTQYDMKNLKFFLKTGVSIEPIYREMPFCRIYFNYLTGIKAVQAYSLELGMAINLDFLVKINLPRSSQKNFSN